MAKHTHTNYSYTCDLCESEMPDEGTQLVGMIVDLQQAVNPEQLPVAQFCARCLKLPISDLVKHFGPSQEYRVATDRAKRRAAEAVKQRRERD